MPGVYPLLQEQQRKDARFKAIVAALTHGLMPSPACTLWGGDSINKENDHESRARNWTVMKVVVDQLGSISGRTITPESDLVADIGIDSLDNIELVMALEEEFSIEIFDEDAEKAITVQDVINYVRSRVAANTAL